MHHNFPISQELSTANIIAEQMLDPLYKPIISHFMSQPGKKDNCTFKGFTTKNGVLLKVMDPDKPIDSTNTRIVIPESLQLALTATYHVAMGHMHARNLYKIISSLYFGESLKRTVDKLTSSCAFLLYVQNITTTQMPPKQFPISHVSNRDLWHGSFFLSKRQGFTCVLLVVDIFSHFTFAFACRDESSRSVCNHLESLISITGAPKIVKK